jgi:adenylate cyclase
MKEKLTYGLLSLLIFVGVLLLINYKIEPFETFSLRFNDINFNLQTKEPSKDIVFVAIDEPSVNKFGRWPWSRDVLAEGLEQFTEANVVVFDMIFSEPTQEPKDAYLAESILNLQSSVCGFFLREKATQFITQEAFERLGDSSLDLLQAEVLEHKNPLFVSAQNAEVNIDTILESCTLSGSFSTLAESDHLMRSYPTAVYYKNLLFPSLGIQTIRLKYNSDIKRVDKNRLSLVNKQIDVDEKGFVRLNFYRLEQYNIVSFLDVVNKKVTPEYFKDKIVILGITEVGAGDVVSTPVGAMYGPLLHYTFISNLLENHLIKEPKYINTLLICMMAFLPFILLLSVKKVLSRAISYIFIYILITVVMRYLFVAEMIYVDLFYPLLSLLLSVAVLEALAFNIHERGSRFLRNAFSSYLSADLLEQLIQNPQALALGGETKELSILFSDIRSFTTISESMTPQKLISLLNRYFTPMTNAVIENNGMLDKYIGDAVMAFFNAPVDVEKHADAACYTALDMMKRLKTLNQELKLENIAPIKIGIGINTADVVVGNMGSDRRFNYTVIGDGVNLASRVEGLTKNYGVNILITEFTVARLHDEFIYRKIEKVRVKGKEEAVLVYELMENTELFVEIKSVYDKALEFYENESFENATPLFTHLVEHYKDALSKYFLVQIKSKVK